MYDVITIGTATRDVFLIGPNFKVLHDSGYLKGRLKKLGFPNGEAECLPLGGKIDVENIVMATGGGATNAAVTFARQGFKTASLFKVGNDNAGQEIINELRREKITVLNFKKNNKNSDGTAYSTILLDPNGEQTILVYRGASEDLSSKEIIFNKLQAKWAYVGPGAISFDVIKKIFIHLRRSGTSIAFSPSRYYLEMGLEKISPFFNQCQVVIMNREEASYLTGIDYDDGKNIFQNLRAAIKGIAIMTDGEKGVWVSSNKNIFKAEVFSAKRVVNRTGAGDAFGSGFIVGLMRYPNDIKYAIRLGLANAASVIENIGAKKGILTKKEFEKDKRWRILEISQKS